MKVLEGMADKSEYYKFDYLVRGDNSICSDYGYIGDYADQRIFGELYGGWIESLDDTFKQNSLTTNLFYIQGTDDIYNRFLLNTFDNFIGKLQVNELKAIIEKTYISFPCFVNIIKNGVVYVEDLLLKQGNENWTEYSGYFSSNIVSGYTQTFEKEIITEKKEIQVNKSIKYTYESSEDLPNIFIKNRDFILKILKYDNYLFNKHCDKALEEYKYKVLCVVEEDIERAKYLFEEYKKSNPFLYFFKTYRDFLEIDGDSGNDGLIEKSIMNALKEKGENNYCIPYQGTDYKNVSYEIIKRRNGKAISTLIHKDTIAQNTKAIEKTIGALNLKKYPPSLDGYIQFLTENNMRFFIEQGRRKSYLNIAKILLSFFGSDQKFFYNKFLTGHSYIVGRSGSGKSELLKSIIVYLNSKYGASISQNKNGNPCILIDPHGDLAEEAINYGWLASSGIYKCVMNTSYGIAPHKKRFVVNPFDIDDKSPANRELVAQEITQLILEMVADSGLSALMETISFPIIYTLLKLPYADFAMFADCIRPSTGQERLEVLRGLVEPHHRAVWADLCGDTYDTTKRSIFNRLQSFLNKRIIGETITGRDDFGQVMEWTAGGSNLVISLPIPIIGEQASQVLGRFFLTRLQIWAKRRQAIAESQRYPVFLVVDEVQNFLSAETARTLDQFGRKFGLFMILANQHIKQIEDSQLKGSILANCKNKIVGMSDKATRQALAGEMGISADEIDNLPPGFFMGKFGTERTLKFYSKMVERFSGDRPTYLETRNTEMSDGWELAGMNGRGAFAVEGSGIAKKIKPKYDL